MPKSKEKQYLDIVFDLSLSKGQENISKMC